MDSNRMQNYIRASLILEALTFVVSVIVFILSRHCGGRFLSGIAYSGHGFWGWAGLYVTCTLFSGIVSMAVLWLLKMTPLRKPDWRYMIAGLVFLLLFVSGIVRHCPWPIVVEIVVGAMAWTGLFLSLYGKPMADFFKKH